MMEQKTATYNGQKVYVHYLCRSGRYALVTYKEDGTGKFKVGISEIKDLQTVIVTTEEVKSKEGE